jgi:hypothetical protein
MLGSVVDDVSCDLVDRRRKKARKEMLKLAGGMRRVRGQKIFSLGALCVFHSGLDRQRTRRRRVGAGAVHQIDAITNPFRSCLVKLRCAKHVVLICFCL